MKAFANETWERSRYAKRISAVVGLAVKGGYYRGAFASFITFGLFGAIALIIWFGADMVHEGQLAEEKLNEFILYALFIVGPWWIGFCICTVAKGHRCYRNHLRFDGRGA